MVFNKEIRILSKAHKKYFKHKNFKLKLIKYKLQKEKLKITKQK